MNATDFYKLACEAGAKFGIDPRHVTTITSNHGKQQASYSITVFIPTKSKCITSKMLPHPITAIQSLEDEIEHFLREYPQVPFDIVISNE